MLQKQLQQPILGIDISDYSVEVLTMKKRGRKPKVMAYNRALLGKGVVWDGKVKEPRVLATTIAKALRNAKPSPIKSRLCLVSLPVSQVLNYSFYLPGALGKKDLRKTIINEVNSSLPIHLKDLYYDFVVNHRKKSGISVLFAAAKKTVVNQYLDVLERAKLFPLAFDVESASMYRSLQLKPDNKVKVLLDLGARTTNVYIFQDGLLKFNHTVDSGGIDLTRAVAKRLRLKFEVAEKTKQQVGLNPNKLEGQVFSALVPPLHEMASDVKKHLSHYKLSNHKKVSTIHLVGGTSLLKGIAQYLETFLEHKVEIADPLSAVTAHGVRMNPKKSVFYTNVLGLGMRGIAMDPYYMGVNLLSQSRYRS